MTAKVWMVRGYSDGVAGRVFTPPNAQADYAAYMHGWKNAEDDLNRSPRATAQELREAAIAILCDESLSREVTSAENAATTSSKQ